MTETPERVDLVCIDVDGTMVGSSGLVHEAVWPAVDRARTHGVRLALCSGRPGFGIVCAYAERLDEEGWHSFQNGGSVMHLATGTTQSSYLSPTIVRELIEQARSTDRVLELYSDTTYAVESTSRRAQEHADLLGVPFVPRRFELLQGQVVRAQWVLSHDEARRMLRSGSSTVEMSPSTSPAMPQTTFVGLTRLGVSKATAVRVIANEHRIPLQRIMFVGDGGNDVSALRLVGVPVAMHNAEPSALAAARHVVGDVDSGGLAEALDLAIALHRG